MPPGATPHTFPKAMGGLYLAAELGPAKDIRREVPAGEGSGDGPLVLGPTFQNAAAELGWGPATTADGMR